MSQRGKRDTMFLFIARDGHKNVGIPAVTGKANISYSYHRQPWVFEFIPDNLGNLVTKYVCNSLWATHGSKPGAGGRSGRQVNQRTLSCFLLLPLCLL